MTYPIEAIREDFPLLHTSVYGKPLVYLDNAATTQKPRTVIERLVSFYTTINGNIHRGVHYLSEQAGEAYESARERVRGYLNAGDADEVIFTAGTTSAINLVARSLGDGGVGASDEIIVTEMEHHSNFVPWQMLCERSGARLRIVPFDDQGRLVLDELDRLVTSRTKLLACGYVSNALGVVHPVGEIIRYAHARGVPVLLDAAQAVQHMRVDVRTLDCDFLAFSGHKMYAATGIGVLYGKKSRLERLPPYQYGGGMVESVTRDGTIFAPPPLRFEAGTPNIAAVTSLEAAIDYIDSLGVEAIARYEERLMDYMVSRLGALPGVTLYGGHGRRCGAVSFTIDGASSYDVGMILDKQGIAVRTGTHCAQPVMAHYGIDGTVRASLALYTTTEEIDRFIEGLSRATGILR